MPVQERQAPEVQEASAKTLRTRLAPLLGHPALRAAGEAVRQGGVTRSSLTISGLTPGAKAFSAAAVALSAVSPVLLLTSGNEAADRLTRMISTFLGWLGGPRERVFALPAFDCSPYEGRSPHPEILERRALALWKIARGECRVLVTPMAAALGRFADTSYYKSLALELKVGDELSLSDFSEHLTGIGYEVSEPVSAPGFYSVRGGIVDVFAPEVDWPVRIEFFGDQVESLREFDPTTQRSRRNVSSTLILPLCEIKRSPALFKILTARLAAREAEPGAASGDPSWQAEYSVTFPGWEFFAPLAEPRPNTLVSLLDQTSGVAAGPADGVGTKRREPPVLMWDEPRDRQRQLLDLLAALAEGFDGVRDMSPPRPSPQDLFLEEAEFRNSAAVAESIGLKELVVSVAGGPHADEGAPETDTPSNPCPESDDNGTGTSVGSAPSSLPEEIPLISQPPTRHRGALKEWIEETRRRIEGGDSLILALAGSGKAERLHEMLSEYDIPFVEGNNFRPTGSPSAEAAPTRLVAGGEELATAEPDADASGRLPLLIVRGDLEEGMSFPDLKLLIESEAEVFGSFAWGRTSRDKSSVISSFISDLSDLKVRDYVVHLDHGIALYQGLRQLEMEGAKRDFMLLTFQEDAKLYVPLERLDLVEKYRSGGEGVKPTLDRLGGSSWARTKSRIKRALRDMAQELLQIYAQRKMSGGHSYAADTPWQREFEDEFEFEETPDQLKALADIKGDLESPEPMDRLLCGDVGYGKTELAMRAAFKVVQEGRQVAVLTPTTVLAFQHYNTFLQRTASFPVRVEMLSRFRSAAEQRAVVAGIQSGKVDIVIGTHRLLSKDVAFQDLGLLIVDEEQRFGVAAKERLKKLRANVDVLTLTATPIPRTLHMSLGGLRDLSVIETPPRGRLAIQTVVAPFNDGVIQAAILQEMARQGQVYFVHNRVDSIFSVAALIQRLVPTARIGVGHGQMAEKELERVMLKFIEHQYDVLVSTSIIENGLDIPLANTLIVNQADRFGLADLYQLRGRVGRSDRRAYAYLLIQAEDSLTPIARRRLAALKEFSDLGAGFRLAALDLELRGAGNLLGGEQSGHLNAIGLDLYLKMLEETVEELKGHAPVPEVHSTLNLGLDIKIPDSYISDESQRLRMYKRISRLSTPLERTDLEAELADRYGSPPSPVATLLSYALLKSDAEQLLVQSIERKGEEIWIRFHPQAPVDPAKIAQFMRRHREAALRPDGSLRFRLAVGDSRLLAVLQSTLRELRASN